MSIVISNFYTIINLYTIRPFVVKRVQTEMIRQRRNSDTDSNDNFYLHGHGVIIDEWKFRPRNSYRSFLILLM